MSPLPQSKYHGVSWAVRDQCWAARGRSEQKWLGYYDSDVEAVEAVNTFEEAHNRHDLVQALPLPMEDAEYWEFIAPDGRDEWEYRFDRAEYLDSLREEGLDEIEVASGATTTSRNGWTCPAPTSRGSNPRTRARSSLGTGRATRSTARHTPFPPHRATSTDRPSHLL